MKSKGKLKQPHKQKEAPDVTGKNRWWLLAAVIVGAIAGILFWVTKNTNDVDNTASIPMAEPVPAAAEKDQLVGKWVRTDSNGGYTLDIASASADGKLEARYFNPNPINVGRAEWQKKENGIMVVVELRDVNYPGSTYTLNFSQANDQLLGTYFQAVEGVNYDVTFARIR